jgi:hypothetical protein
MVKSAQFNLDSPLFEEMSDTDAKAIVGGSVTGAVDTLVTGATGIPQSFGNQGRPTTGAVGLVTGTTGAATHYLNTVNGGLESGLFQPLNQTVTDTGSEVASSV